MVMQTNGINYYTPGWNNGTYIPPVQNPMGGYTAPQYVPQSAIPVTLRLSIGFARPSDITLSLIRRRISRG